MRWVALPCSAAVSLVAAALLPGCGHARPCEGGDRCPKGTVCQLDGTCAPMQSSRAWRFARAERMFALDWTTSEAASRTSAAPDDQLVIGGRHAAVAHLDFGPLPKSVEVVHAVLALDSYPGWGGVEHPWRVAVHASRPVSVFRNRLPPLRRYVAPARVVRMRPGIGRSLFVDVTPLATAAVHRGDDRLSLALVALDRNAPEMRFASPEATDQRARPRVDLSLR